MPEKIKRRQLYYLKTEVPIVIGFMIDNEEFGEFTSHLHVMGRGSGSRYMLTDDERTSETRLKVFGEYAAENKSVSNELIFEGLRALPLGQAMRRTMRAKSKGATEPLDEDKKLGIRPREKIMVVQEKVAEPVKEQLSSIEMSMYGVAYSRCAHLETTGMSPYKIIILDMIMSSGAPLGDEAIKKFLKEKLGQNFSKERAESALNSMFYNPFVGRNSRVGVHGFMQAGQAVTVFGRVINK